MIEHPLINPIFAESSSAKRMVSQRRRSNGESIPSCAAPCMV